mmetsp:Transcript_25840/g.36772  ORF Transcript_25840/g.36772 Transcript_25840/m.36772 type:complete len:290 (-) Transcript_25840:243-1112(-)
MQRGILLGRILRIVAAYRPEKDNPRRIRFTVGGNLIEYLGKTSTKAADITTVKILFNSVLSTDGARFITLDLKDFYLNTPMEQYEYMRIPLNIIPDTIIDEYNLRPLIHKGHVYVEIQKGMYGLPQAGKIANDQLIKILKPHGYTEYPITPGLWKHETRSIKFCLVVDDFGIKYTNPDDVTHLLDIQILTCKTHSTQRLSPTTRHSPIRSQGTIHKFTRHLPRPRPRRQKTRLRSPWHTTVLFQSNRLPHVTSNRHHCHSTIQPHQKNNGGSDTITELLCHTPQRHHSI